jgi:hypothetical protein
MDTKTEYLKLLNDIVRNLPQAFGTCKGDPANLNNLYTLLGEMCMALTAINNHLSSTTDK